MPTQRVILAEYFTTNDLTFLFVAREDFSEPQVIQLKTPLAEMRDYVTATFGSAEAIYALDESGLAEWNARFGPLVEPILEWADEDDIIWFVPHDVLHYVPLHAVKVQGRYLIERNPVCYSPSASVMKYCHTKRKGRRQNALVIGDPLGDLSHAREEAFTVADLFGTEPVIGEAAQKASVVSLLSEHSERFDILHFACHGRLDREQPLRSGIVLAGDGQDANDVDGCNAERLTADEIFQLQLEADLVTLSACDSGVNERRPGDELIGLTRALIYAGTPSVLVSLWAVNDFSTRLLMEKFYLELRNSNEKNPVTKAEALRIAQRYVMNLTISQLAEEQKTRSRPQGDDVPHATERRLRDLSDGKVLNGEKAAADPNAKAFGHPYHWAPFVLVGDWK